MKIGATDAVAYLDDVAALFPSGKVSRDGDKRYRVVERLERRKGGDPLRHLDATHRPAMKKLVTALRAYVKKNRLALQKACASRPATPVPGEIELMQSALGQLERMVEQQEDRLLDVKAKAKARGVRRLNGKEDPRMTAFFDALGALGVAEWTDIARRGIKDVAKMTWGFNRASSVSIDLGRGIIIPAATHRRSIHAPAMAARDRFLERTVGKLPATVGRGSATIPLRETIRRMIIHATVVLMVHDWLIVSPQGSKAAANVLAPFRGFAPLPQ